MALLLISAPSTAVPSQMIGQCNSEKPCCADHAQNPGKSKPSEPCASCYFCWAGCCGIVPSTVEQLWIPAATATRFDHQPEKAPRRAYPPPLPPPRLPA